MNTFKIAVALNLDYSFCSAQHGQDWTRHVSEGAMCFPGCPQLLPSQNALSNVDIRVQSNEIIIGIHRHHPVNTGCPQRIGNWSSMISSRTKSLSMLTWSSCQWTYGCFKSQEFCLQVPFVHFARPPKQREQSKTRALLWDIGITSKWNVIHDMCNAVNALCMWASLRARGRKT